MLSVSDVSVAFGPEVVLKNVSFVLPDAGRVGLIGPNGAGKTTLFNLMTGLTPPTGGQLFYEGEEITGLRPHRIAAKGIARTFQNIRLFGNLSALEREGMISRSPAAIVLLDAAQLRRILAADT